MATTIGCAQIGDLQLIQELNKKCLPIWYSYVDLFIMYSSGNTILFVKMDNKIVGYLIAKQNHILSIGVDQTYRTKGIGTALLNHFASKFYPSNTTLYVHIENTNAIRFYEKNGFQKIQTMHNYYNGSLKANSQDAYLMKKIENKTT